MKKTRRRNYSENHLTVNRQKKRLKTSENGGESALPIPIDLVFEIFSRLPVKSIARCRCVSKIWASTLSRREFTELFLSKSISRPQFLFACKTWNGLFVFSSPQPHNPDENSSPIIANYQMSFPFDGRYEIIVVIGLVCATRYKRLSNGRKETIMVICNPSTGESLPLKKVKTSRTDVMSLLGYDPIDKGFKVLSMTWGHSLMEEEHQVLTLGTGKWRMVECCIRGRQGFRNKEVCINGVMYYQTICWPENINGICCFDIRSEKFSFIKVNETIRYATLVNYNGNLGLLWSGYGDGFYEGSTSLKLWVLEDVERQEWCKRIIVLPTLWKDVVGKNTLTVVGVTGTNEIVFRARASDLSHPLYLFYFNIDKNTIVRVEIQGLDRYKYGGIHVFMNHVEDVKLI